jgi:DNA-binding transcriptional MerR regulator
MNSLYKKKKEGQQEGIPDKYFSVQKVSEITQLRSHILRFWESQFKQLHPQRTRGGHRRYQKKDVELILWIRNLLYEKKLTIKGAKEELKRRERQDLIDPAILGKELEEVLDILNGA